ARSTWRTCSRCPAWACGWCRRCPPSTTIPKRWTTSSTTSRPGSSTSSTCPPPHVAGRECGPPVKGTTNMPFDDLRSFLETLDKEGQLLRITDQVMPEPDIAAAANAACRMGDGAPALYFDNVAGFTSARIAMNVHGSWANHALALDLPKGTGVKEQ